jgi:hypothetical protein
MKYGNREVAEGWSARHQELFGRALALPKVAAPSEAMRRVADLDHDFSMAEARW